MRSPCRVSRTATKHIPLLCRTLGVAAPYYSWIEMTRLHGYFLPTERDAPADAEALSHKLGVRAGLFRQVGAGLWSWLPAGYGGHEDAGQRAPPGWAPGA